MMLVCALFLTLAAAQACAAVVIALLAKALWR